MPENVFNSKEQFVQEYRALSDRITELNGILSSAKGEDYQAIIEKVHFSYDSDDIISVKAAKCAILFDLSTKYGRLPFSSEHDDFLREHSDKIYETDNYEGYQYLVSTGKSPCENVAIELEHYEFIKQSYRAKYGASFVPVNVEFTRVYESIESSFRIAAYQYTQFKIDEESHQNTSLGDLTGLLAWNMGPSLLYFVLMYSAGMVLGHQVALFGTEEPGVQSLLLFNSFMLFPIVYGIADTFLRLSYKNHKIRAYTKNLVWKLDDFQANILMSNVFIFARYVCLILAGIFLFFSIATNR